MQKNNTPKENNNTVVERELGGNNKTIAFHMSIIAFYIKIERVGHILVSAVHMLKRLLSHMYIDSDHT